MLMKASELIEKLGEEVRKRGYDLDVVAKLSFVDIGGATETVWSELEAIEVFNGTAILKGA